MQSDVSSWLSSTTTIAGVRVRCSTSARMIAKRSSRVGRPVMLSSSVAAISLGVGRDGNETHSSGRSGAASASSTAKVLPRPASPCSTAIAPASTASATARWASR
jgi:hypothetical protein